LKTCKTEYYIAQKKLYLAIYLNNLVFAYQIILYDMDIYELNNLLKKLHSDDLGQNRNTLLEILEVLGDLSESLQQGKVKVKPWECFFEILIQKLLFHSYSVCELTKGLEIKSKRFNKKTEIIDFPSLFILTRASIESFLTLEYIYMKDISEEEKFFRFKLWEVSGLMARQGFETGGDEELENKKNSEKELIIRIQEDIEKNPKFSSLNKQQLNRLRTYGLPRIESWSKMIEVSILNDELFQNIYKFFSNYAHSEYLSIL